MQGKTLARAGAVLLATLLVTTCQGLFTFSPLSFLRRDPANLPTEQKIAWAEEALASNDEEAMAEAYDAIKDLPGVSTDPELSYLAASLAMELSGAPDLLYQVLNGDIDFADTVNVESELTSFLASLQTTYLVEAAGYFASTVQLDPSILEGSDYLLGAGCLLLEAAETLHGGDVSLLTGADLGNAADPSTVLGFVDLGLNDPDVGDSTLQLLTDLNALLTDPAVFP